MVNVESNVTNIKLNMVMNVEVNSIRTGSRQTLQTQNRQ